MVHSVRQECPIIVPTKLHYYQTYTHSFDSALSAFFTLSKPDLLLLLMEPSKESRSNYEVSAIVGFLSSLDRLTRGFTV